MQFQGSAEDLGVDEQELAAARRLNQAESFRRMLVLRLLPVQSGAKRRSILGHVDRPLLSAADMKFVMRRYRGLIRKIYDACVASANNETGGVAFHGQWPKRHCAGAGFGSGMRLSFLSPDPWKFQTFIFKKLRRYSYQTSLTHFASDFPHLLVPARGGNPPTLPSDLLFLQSCLRFDGVNHVSAAERWSDGGGLTEWRRE